MGRRREQSPLECPECGADLGQFGAVIVALVMPTRSVGHLEPGAEGEKVVVVIDKPVPAVELELQCGETAENVWMAWILRR